MDGPVDSNDTGCKTGRARAITSMQKPNEHYRVLVFNQCEARLQYLARTGHSLHVVPPQHNPEKRWRSGLWPLPKGKRGPSRDKRLDDSVTHLYTQRL